MFVNSSDDMKSKPTILVRLVHFEGPLKGEIQEFTESTILIGRHPACHVTFPKDERKIHRKHALITREGNRFKVINQGVNGTFVNGKRIEQTFLEDGDILMFAPGGPKVGFSTEALSGRDGQEAVNPQEGPRETKGLPRTPQPHDHSVRDKPVVPQADDAPIRKVQVPLVIQYGPTLRSFKELPVTAGKNPACDFILTHPSILDRHAVFFASENQYYVKDLTGRNLVSINGSPVGTQAPLHPDSLLALSPQGPTFRFLGGGRLAEV
jgi:pSer/pThr/pTyr-binding forkhead associated (FHA) protein